MGKSVAVDEGVFRPASCRPRESSVNAPLRTFVAASILVCAASFWAGCNGKTILVPRQQTGLFATESRQKIYVGTLDTTVETFDMDGHPTTPTLAWLHQPRMGAVDADGNIYVTSVGNGSMEKYNSSGFQVSPTIVNLNRPRQVVVDAGGKMYI